MKVKSVCAAMCVLSAATNADILIINSGSDIVMRADDMGNVIEPGFMNLNFTNVAPQTPKGLTVVNDEIWITDSLSDVIYRYSRSTVPVFLGTIGGPGGGLDGMRGLAFINGTVYVTTSGTDNGAPGDAIVRISPAGTILGSFPATNPFDIVLHNGNLLVSNADDESLDIYSLAGAFLGSLHDSDGVSGIDFPQQIFVKDNGNLLVAGFSAPFGVYEYNSLGQQLNFYPLPGPRGVIGLPDGQILWTQGQGPFRYNPATNTSESLYAGESCQYMLKVELTPGCRADFNHDGFVDGFDYDDFVACFEGDPCPPNQDADYNDDGFPDGFDYDDFVADFEAGCF